MGDGGIDIQGFLGNLLAAVRRKMLERSHVVQPIGQFDEHYADVIHHGQHHLAQIFSLLFLAGREIDGADLGDALNNVSHLLAKFLADINDRYRCIFNRVVKQAGRNRDRVHFHFRENQRDFQRVSEIGLAGSAGLASMIFL